MTGNTITLDTARHHFEPGQEVTWMAPDGTMKRATVSRVQGATITVFGDAERRFWRWVVGLFGAYFALVVAIAWYFRP